MGPHPLDDDAPTGDRQVSEPLAAAPAVRSQGGTAASFTAGARIESRYRIVRFLAQGGMGEVYEAHDEELQQRVALKTLRSHLGGHPQMLDQFRREVQLALAVTHPNVCRVYDIGRHEGAVFLTMQFLEGETLAERLERGPLPLAEALSLAGQMAAALDAAHQTGIVHRDFKSANVMLTGPGGARALVTDFGLAQPASGVAASLVGSYPYMSPEQVEGGAITAAADIYALGVVLFEMVTGQRPFRGANPLETARLRLTQAPPSPRSLRSGLPARWEKVILRCLARDPAARYPSAGAAAAALHEERQGTPARSAAALVLAGLVAVGTLAPARAGWRPSQAPPSAAPSHRPSVAVIGVEGMGAAPDDAWLGDGLSEMLASELAAGEDLRVVSSATVSRVRRELGPLGAPEEGYAHPLLARLRATLGTDVIVAGSWQANAGGMQLDLTVQDAESGRVLARRSEAGRRDDLSGLIRRAGMRVREALALAAPPAEGAALGTQQAEATRWYSEGLARLRGFDPIQARALLEKAVAADPEFALARIALAEAWSALGYDGRAREEAARAAAATQGLPREQKLYVEASAANLQFDRAAAARLFASLFGFFPDNLDYGLQLAAAQARSGAPDAAWTTIQQIRQAGLGADDPRLDLQEALIASFRRDVRAQVAATRRALSLATARGEDVLLARASLEHARSLVTAGERRAGIDAARTALRLFQDLDDRSGAASALALMAYVQMALDAPDANRALAEALALHREVGNRRAVGFDQVMFSFRFIQQGHYAQAVAARQEAMAIFAEIGAKTSVTDYQPPQAGDLFALGRTTEAVQTCRAALAVLRELRRANKSLDCGMVMAATGELSQASELSAEFAHQAPQINPETVADAQQGAADLDWLRGNFAAARRQAEAARTFFAAQPHTWSLAMANHTLAAVALAEGRPAEAVARASEAEEGFRLYPSPHYTWMHAPVRPLALLTQGKVVEAAALIDDPAWPLARTEHVPANLAVEVARGRIHGAQGRADAKATLEKARAKAAELQIPLLELDARAALAELDLRGANAADARRELEHVEIEARTRGLLVLARRIAALLSPAPKPAELRS